MQQALVTTGHYEQPDRIILDEPLPAEITRLKVIIEPLPTVTPRRKVGALKGLIKVLPGFDDPIEDFQEYME